MARRVGDPQGEWAVLEEGVGAPGDSTQRPFVIAGAAPVWCGSAERKEDYSMCEERCGRGTSSFFITEHSVRYATWKRETAHILSFHKWW